MTDRAIDGQAGSEPGTSANGVLRASGTEEIEGTGITGLVEGRSVRGGKESLYRLATRAGEMGFRTKRDSR